MKIKTALLETKLRCAFVAQRTMVLGAWSDTTTLRKLQGKASPASDLPNTPRRPMVREARDSATANFRELTGTLALGPQTTVQTSDLDLPVLRIGAVLVNEAARAVNRYAECANAAAKFKRPRAKPSHTPARMNGIKDIETWSAT